MGSSGPPGLALGRSQKNIAAQYERNQLKKLGLQAPEGFAQQSANEVFHYALSSDNPENFAEFMASLDPNKTIASRFGIRDDPETIPEEPEPEPDKVEEKTEAPSLFEEPIVRAAQARESSQAAARAGRSSTVKTTPQGLTTKAAVARPSLQVAGRKSSAPVKTSPQGIVSEAVTSRPTLLAAPVRRRGLKTLLGQ